MVDAPLTGWSRCSRLNWLDKGACKGLSVLTSVYASGCAKGTCHHQGNGAWGMRGVARVYFMISACAMRSQGTNVPTASRFVRITG